MDKKKNTGQARFNLLLAAAAFLATLGLVLGGAYVREGYNVQVGSVSQQKIKAPRKVENIIATQRNKDAAAEAAEMMDPVTERDNAANERMIGYVSDFFSVVDDYRAVLAGKQSQPPPVVTPTPAASEISPEANPNEEIPEVPTEETQNVEPQPTATAPVAVTPEPQRQVTLPINLRDAQIDLLVNLSSSELENFKEQTLNALNNILEDGIQQIDQKSLSNAKDKIDMLEMTGDEKTLANDIIRKYLEPNVIINEDATQKAREERAAKYETLYYLKDQMIIDESQIVTEEAYAVLESLGLIQKGYIDNIWLMVGAVIVVFAIFTLTILYIYRFYKKAIVNKKEMLLLFTLYMIVICVTWLFNGAQYLFLPILVFTMLIALMFDPRMSIVLNFSVTIICLMIFKGDLEFLIFYILSGIFISLISNYATERNKLIVVGLLTCAVNVSIYLGVSLFFEKKFTDALLIGSVYAFVAGIFVVILSIGSTPLWESVFGVITAYRLQDLTNPNNLLLRRLMIEAPGTYHHSLIVANLAETAAFEIGANPSLARVGGHYHDVGKLKYPQYFAENQVTGNVHDTMDPYSSVQLIVSHVSFGLELAEQNHLPPVIKDIIAQHHGNGLIKYFYHKAQSAGKEVDEADFRYNFPIPQSKEAVVVMLADTVEAAVRSMIPTGKTMPEVESFVRTLIRDKLDEGQLNDSMLTIKDIETIILCFMRVFKGMYHERISYPATEKLEVKPAEPLT